jgi:redox-sensitive bicupin YhaK (pirin superfamily)|eukprot:g4222.t1
MSIRKATRILPPPRAHWVGDGFHVKPVFADMAFTERVSPFLMFDFAEPKRFPKTEKKLGVGQHPHRGFETVTIAFKGEVEHGDSEGNRGVIGEGDVQWMTAARGIIHEEFHSRKFAQNGGEFSMAQIWVNLPKKHKMTKPKYQPILKKQIAEVSLGEDGCVARVIAGSCNGTKGPATTFSPLNMWDVRLADDKVVDLKIPKSHNAILFVREGSLNVFESDEKDCKPRKLQQSQVLLLPPGDGDTIRISALDGDSKVLFLSGDPIDEPIAHQGPFVMNTREEIRQAWDDFYSGRLGKHF